MHIRYRNIHIECIKCLEMSVNSILTDKLLDLFSRTFDFDGVLGGKDREPKVLGVD